MNESYISYILEKLKKLLSIDSPTGYTDEAAEWVCSEYRRMGFDARITNKGGVMVDFGGPADSEGLLIETHMDSLGGMVAEIKGDGRLRITPLGGMNANNAECENVRIITKFSGSYEGTLQLINPSIHVNGSYNSTPRTFDSTEIVLDENVRSAIDVRALGIDVGDIVCFDPRTRITESGYIKSRFLDDKLSVAIMMGVAKYIKDQKLELNRRVWLHVTVFEEVSHGGSASVPEGVTEGLSVDMGCVGTGLSCTEHQVSICAKDSHGPYHYGMTKRLIEAAKRAGADYAVDVYPFYGSDVEATLRAGWDIRHGLIGAGVFASHGYERSHVDGVRSTAKLILAFLFPESEELGLSEGN